MAEFSVTAAKLRGNADEISGISSSVLNCSSRINQVCSRLSLHGSASTAVRRNLRELSSGIEKQSGQVKNASSMLSQIASLYETTEKQIAGLKFETGIPESTGGSGQGGRSGDGAGAETTETEDKSPIDTLLDLFKNTFGFLGKVTDNGVLNFLKPLFGYMGSFVSYFTGIFGGNDIYGAGADFCDFTKNSIDLWKGFYDVLTPDDPKIAEQFKQRWGTKAAYAGIIASLAGMAGKVTEAIGNHGTWGEKASSWIDAAGESADVVKSIYDLRHLADATKGMYTPAGLWVTFADTCTSAISQTVESVDKYSQDGSWDWNDTASVGIDMSISGLNSLISGVSFGFVSLESFGTTPEEFSQGVKNWATNVGKDLGNFYLWLTR